MNWRVLAVVLAAFTLFALGVAYLTVLHLGDRYNPEGVVAACWDARLLPGRSNEYEISLDAIIVGEPHHGFVIVSRTARCPEQRLIVLSTNSQISEHLHQLELRTYEALLARRAASREDSPLLGTGLRMTVHAKVERTDHDDNLAIDLRGIGRIERMSDAETRRFVDQHEI